MELMFDSITGSIHDFTSRSGQLFSYSAQSTCVLNCWPYSRRSLFTSSPPPSFFLNFLSLLRLIILIQQSPMKQYLLLLFFLLTIHTNSFKDCNFTQFDFFSHISLGKLDELNKTFTALNGKVNNLTAVSYTNKDSVVYTISQAKPTFAYLDSTQKGQIIANDIIYIKGGKTETKIAFNWSKDQLKGTGLATCLSDSITFAKLFYLDAGFMQYKLADLQNISYFASPCVINRVDPILQKKDLQTFTSIFNDYSPNDVKTNLILEIMKYYQTLLNNSLYDQKQPINNSSEYQWIDPTPGKSNLTIKYTLLPTGAHLQPTGLSLNFVTEITDDDNWKCGASVPSQPLDTKIYGGIQQFLSLSIFQNTIRYAIEKGQLDTKLNQVNWQSQSFQFYAGDLYEIIPEIATKFRAYTQLLGTCNATKSGLKVIKSSNDSLQVTINYNCQLYVIGGVQISVFDVLATFIVQIFPNQDSLDFRVVKCSKFAHFKDVSGFVIHDIQLANYYLTQCLARLYEGKVFGSGWKIYARDSPNVLIQDGSILIYDSAALH